MRQAISDNVITPTRQAQVNAALSQLHTNNQIDYSLPPLARAYFPGKAGLITAGSIESLWRTAAGLGNATNTIALHQEMKTASDGAWYGFKTKAILAAQKEYNTKAIAAAQTLSLASLGIAGLKIAAGGSAFDGLNNAQIDAISMRRDHIINLATHLRELVEEEADANQKRILQDNADHLDDLIDYVDRAKGTPAHARHVAASRDLYRP